MTAYPLWVITCSVDGVPIDWAEHGETMGNARRNAREAGWMTGRGTRGPDYCPEHRPDRTSPISQTGESP
jgi:hypothetical protein